MAFGLNLLWYASPGKSFRLRSKLRWQMADGNLVLVSKVECRPRWVRTIFSIFGHSISVG